MSFLQLLLFLEQHLLVESSQTSSSTHFFSTQSHSPLLAFLHVLNLFAAAQLPGSGLSMHSPLFHVQAESFLQGFFFNAGHLETASSGALHSAQCQPSYNVEGVLPVHSAVVKHQCAPLPAVSAHPANVSYPPKGRGSYDHVSRHSQASVVGSSVVGASVVGASVVGTSVVGALVVGASVAGASVAGEVVLQLVQNWLLD